MGTLGVDGIIPISFPNCFLFAKDCHCRLFLVEYHHELLGSTITPSDPTAMHEGTAARIAAEYWSPDAAGHRVTDAAGKSPATCYHPTEYQP
jgi:hypothetical protein